MSTISENLQIIKGSTDAIKQAIIDKGGTISGDITTWADAISGIETGGSSDGSTTPYIKVFSVKGIGKFPYEVGMTWEDWFDADYGYMRYDDNGGISAYLYTYNNIVMYRTPSGISGTLRVEDSSTDILITDTIDSSITNYDYYVEICCFVAGTLILMSDNSYVPIQDIKEGDEVLSYDIDKNCFYSTIVKKLIIKENIHTIAVIKFENGKELTMNEYHPILTDNGWHSLTRYNNYDELVIGDNCKTTSGWSKIISIDKYSSEEGVKMYNLDVIDKDESADIELNDNFIANNIIVHNGFC